MCFCFRQDIYQSKSIRGCHTRDEGAAGFQQKRIVLNLPQCTGQASGPHTCITYSCVAPNGSKLVPQDLPILSNIFKIEKKGGRRTRRGGSSAPGNSRAQWSTLYLGVRSTLYQSPGLSLQTEEWVMSSRVRGAWRVTSKRLGGAS